MYLIVIAWMYVVLMMSVAQATHSNGSVLGALVTFFMYGVLPLSLVIYLLKAPGRSKAIKQRERQAWEAAQREAQPPSAEQTTSAERAIGTESSATVTPVDTNQADPATSTQPPSLPPNAA